MNKRLLSLVLCLAFVLSAFCFVPSVKAGATLAMPDNDGHTNGVSYTLGKGTTAETTVTCNFIPSLINGAVPYARPGDVQVQKYIVIHNTGNYSDTADAQAHNEYICGAGADQSYHYVVGSDGIYQSLPDNERGRHAGKGLKHNGPTNSNTIGIETCVNLFPATSTSSGEQWNTQEMYDWYENEFALRTDRVALLAATLCIRYGMNPYTQVIQHNDVYDKNCPMQMRYVFNTAGTFDHDNGTYWLIFWNKMIEYYEQYGGTFTSTDTAVIGTDGLDYGPRYTESSALVADEYTRVITTTSINVRATPVTGAIVYVAKQNQVLTFSEAYIPEGKDVLWGKIATVDGVDFTTASGGDPEGWMSFNPSYSTPVVAEGATAHAMALEAPNAVKPNVGSPWATTYVSDSNTVTLSGYVLGYNNEVSAVQYKVGNASHWTNAQTVERPDLKTSVPGYPYYRDCGWTVTFDITDWDESTVVTFQALDFYYEAFNVGTVTITKGDIKLPFELLENSDYTLADGKLAGVSASTTVADIAAQFKDDIEVFDAEGAAVASTSVVGTGYVVKEFEGEGQATLVIKGDVNGDGLVNSADCAASKAHLRLMGALSGVYLEAAEMNGDSSLNTVDYIRLKLAAKF